MSRPADLAGSCPICGGELLAPARGEPDGDALVNCHNCGRHLIETRSALFLVEYFRTNGLSKRSAIAHAIRQIPDGNHIAFDTVLRIVDRARLPLAHEVLENLLLYMARASRPGALVPLRSFNLLATIGLSTEAELRWVLLEAHGLDLIRVDEPAQGNASDGWGWMNARLTMKGWHRYRDLIRVGQGSRRAFMAMAFGDEELQAFYRNHLRPAAADVGFDLRTMEEDHKTAGSIDNRMRVELRTSRFVICDLTNGNRGAYWEAGFAEGLGRPVFYVCRDDVLEDRTHHHHPHFDTAHQLIIGWDPAEPETGLAELKAAIRATLPAEATMEDT